MDAVLIPSPKNCGGRSRRWRTWPVSGSITRIAELPFDWGPNIYEWTWQSHICFVFDRFSLRPGGRFTYSGQGWGMTRTAREIVASDGTATLRFRDPKTFKQVRHVVVKDEKYALQQLNELEYVKGETMPTFGTRTGSHGFHRGMDMLSAGSISPL